MNIKDIKTRDDNPFEYITDKDGPIAVDLYFDALHLLLNDKSITWEKIIKECSELYEKYPYILRFCFRTKRVFHPSILFDAYFSNTYEQYEDDYLDPDPDLDENRKYVHKLLFDKEVFEKHMEKKIASLWFEIEYGDEVERRLKEEGLSELIFEYNILFEDRYESLINNEKVEDVSLEFRNMCETFLD